MTQLRQQEKRFDELNVKVKVVSFDANFLAIAYIENTNLKWPLLLDTQLELYKAYGMERATWRQIYGVASILKYLKLIFSGQLPGKPGKDYRQLGGNVLIDLQGIVRMHYVSISPHDRPDIDEIFRIIQSAD